MKEYLIETPSIDFNNPLVHKKVLELRNQSSDDVDYIRECYHFVRDEISHSWDIKTDMVSKTASEVLKNKTGICWTKSCLLAALLRASQIPSGISYQLLTRADDESEGHIIHALNTVYINNLKGWVRLDARGNKENVHAHFNLDTEQLAFNIRPEFGEMDYHDNHPDLDERLVNALEKSKNVNEIHADFRF